jgi:hypothetical protein
MTMISEDRLRELCSGSVMAAATPGEEIAMARELLTLRASPPPSGEDRGWVLVPREPTKEMIAAGLLKNDRNPHPWCPAVYRAMIDAAPALPTIKEPTDGK